MFACCCSEDKQEVDIIYAGTLPEVSTSSETYIGSEKFEKAFKDVAATSPEPQLTKYNSKTVPDENPTFLVYLEEPESPEKLGLHLDLSDGETAYILHVSQNSDQPAAKWNATVQEEHQKLAPGVYIISINNKFGGSNLTDLVQSGKKMSMLCRRPSLRRVKVSRAGNTNLGLDLQFAKRGRVLTVTRILEGAVKESGAEILPGDRILEVDGVQGISEDLLKTLSESLNPTLVLSRCP
eukprot:CAMPEP_0206591498 /NCGR_PEP_ID=MMETSP0325_2-20121206/40300_1 /ASSEMBLY_ACC=CAM_ASM_000347 /TAXON_ID=2866 /ORGANISM="Crypthecodinium cohnii, Strain Seligo" /LENGTH=237 /DNA_ID=CAMNT_0054100751 /DNA_START=846 /DNA_END=1555 /DNA_ORIENTATION=+